MTVHALETDTGRERWRREPSDKATTPSVPVAAAGPVSVTASLFSAGSAVWGAGPGDGRGPVAVALRCFQHECATLYVAAADPGLSGNPPPAMLAAVDVRNGRELWRTRTGVERIRMLESNHGVVLTGGFKVPEIRGSFLVQAADARTGKRKSTTDLPHASVDEDFEPVLVGTTLCVSAGASTNPRGTSRLSVSGPGPANTDGTTLYIATARHHARPAGRSGAGATFSPEP